MIWPLHSSSSRRCSGQCTPHHEENGARARTSVTATGSGARTGFVSCRAGGSRLPDGRSEKGREKDAQYTGREAEGAERGSTTNCEGCDRAAEDVRIDQELLDGFGVSVCRDCKVGTVTFMPGPSILRCSDVLIGIQYVLRYSTARLVPNSTHFFFPISMETWRRSSE